MGDTDAPAESVSCEIAKPSIDILKEAKPMENIAEETNVQKEDKTKSDIFAVEAVGSLPSTIFSIGGAPSKTIHKTASGNSKDSAQSSESKGSGQFRNPVTGIGVSSNDEFRTKPTKRKDGNPVLGVGYKDDAAVLNYAQAQRIPPGGHSKGLW